MQVDFYHLTRQPLDHVLPRIAERVVASGGRLLVVAEDAGERTRLDRLLWSWQPESFLPHGLSGTEGDADQPVLIGEQPVAANAAASLAIVDGRWRDEALAFERAFHLFDEEVIAAARGAWRVLGERDGVERRYWKQDDDGRWRQVA